MTRVEKESECGRRRSFERRRPRFVWGLLANFDSPGGLLPGGETYLGQLVQIRIFQRVCKGRPEPDWAEFDFLNRWRRSYKGEKGCHGAQSDFKPLY